MRRLGVSVLMAVGMSPLLAVLPPMGGGTVLADDSYSATIRRTSHGIPHILAADFGGLGYGYGYAFAQDNICVMADQYATVRAQRSRYFGPNNSWTMRANSTVNNNLNSDFYFQQIIDSGVVEKLVAEPPPLGLVDGARQGVRGYVAGYNRYLADVGMANIADPACHGAAWVQPITEMDAYRRFYELALLASGDVAIDGIGSAQPPTPPAPIFSGINASQLTLLRERFDTLHEIGSNAYGLGRDATDNGHGMVLGNPHFPWEGTERLYQAQLTIPGVVNVEGSSLFGVPIVLIGHTDSVAWSHTVSTAYRFTPYQLTLVPGSPTTYLYDGQPRQMTSRTMTVQAKQADGTLAPVTRTLWSTHYGPVMTSLLNLPIFPWTPATAFAMRDANAANFRYINHFFAVNQAHTVGDIYRIQADLHGIPWVNTIAADNAGDAYYGDVSNVPNVSNAKAQACDTIPVGVATFAALGLPILDGSKSACEWDIDADSPQPGTFGTSHLPHLFRTDYVTNSNDSFWLSNPAAPLTGFARIIGDEATARSLRTRLGLIQVQQRLAGTDGRPGNRWTTAQLQETVFSNRQYTGELARGALVSMCNGFGGMAPTTGGPPVSVGTACTVLADWDLHDNLGSHGAILFRRWFEHVRASIPSPAPNPTIWNTAFSAADPVNTPRDLNTSNPLIQAALGDAIKEMNDAAIPLNAPLLGYQYKPKDGENIPIHGGPGSDGVFNAINVTWSAPKAYPNVTHGSSFVMVAHFNGTPCPDVHTITTYSQSTDPTSPWFADQTRMFSNKEWVTEPFCEAAIAADPNLTITTLTSAPAAQMLPNSDAGRPLVVWAGLALALGLGTLLRRSRRAL